MAEAASPPPSHPTLLPGRSSALSSDSGGEGGSSSGSGGLVIGLGVALALVVAALAYRHHVKRTNLLRAARSSFAARGSQPQRPLPYASPSVPRASRPAGWEASPPDGSALSSAYVLEDGALNDAARAAKAAALQKGGGVEMTRF